MSVPIRSWGSGSWPDPGNHSFQIVYAMSLMDLDWPRPTKMLAIQIGFYLMR